MSTPTPLRGLAADPLSGHVMPSSTYTSYHAATSGRPATVAPGLLKRSRGVDSVQAGGVLPKRSRIAGHSEAATLAITAAAIGGNAADGANLPGSTSLTWVRPHVHEVVLPEASYAAHMEAIIERDFFGDLPRLQQQLEWLTALESGDSSRISAARAALAASVQRTDRLASGAPTPAAAVSARGSSSQGAASPLHSSLGGSRLALLGGATPLAASGAVGEQRHLAASAVRASSAAAAVDDDAASVRSVSSWSAGLRKGTKVSSATAADEDDAASVAAGGGGPRSVAGSVAAASTAGSMSSEALGPVARAALAARRMGLNAFLLRYTGEDNASFAANRAAYEEASARRRWWLHQHVGVREKLLMRHDGDARRAMPAGARVLAGSANIVAADARALADGRLTGPAGADGSGGRGGASSSSSSSSAAGAGQGTSGSSSGGDLQTWRHRPRNALFFTPDLAASYDVSRVRAIPFHPHLRLPALLTDDQAIPASRRRDALAAAGGLAGNPRPLLLADAGVGVGVVSKGSAHITSGSASAAGAMLTDIPSSQQQLSLDDLSTADAEKARAGTSGASAMLSSSSDSDVTGYPAQLSSTVGAAAIGRAAELAESGWSLSRPSSSMMRGAALASSSAAGPGHKPGTSLPESLPRLLTNGLGRSVVGDGHILAASALPSSAAAAEALAASVPLPLVSSMLVTVAGMDLLVPAVTSRPGGPAGRYTRADPYGAGTGGLMGRTGGISAPQQLRHAATRLPSHTLREALASGGNGNGDGVSSSSTGASAAGPHGGGGVLGFDVGAPAAVIDAAVAAGTIGGRSRAAASTSASGGAANGDRDGVTPGSPRINGYGFVYTPAHEAAGLFHGGAATPLLAAGNTALPGAPASAASAAAAASIGAGAMMSLPPATVDPVPDYQPFRVSAAPSRDAAAEALRARVAARHRSTSRSGGAHAGDTTGSSAGGSAASAHMLLRTGRSGTLTGGTGRPAFAATPTPALAAAILGAALHPQMHMSGSSSGAASSGVGAAALAAAAASPALTSASLLQAARGRGGSSSSAASVVSSSRHSTGGRSGRFVAPPQPQQLSGQARRIVAQVAAEHHHQHHRGGPASTPAAAATTSWPAMVISQSQSQSHGGTGSGAGAGSARSRSPGLGAAAAVASSAAATSSAARMITDALLGAGRY